MILITHVPTRFRSTMRLRALLVACLLAVAGSVGLVAATPASAAAYNCSGQPATHILHTFAPRIPYQLVPLRCGTSAYGYLHIKARYDSDPLFEENIRNTLADPIVVSSSGTSAVFWNLVEGCEPGAYFKVVVEFSHYSDGKPKGIITAYATNANPPASARAIDPSTIRPACG